MTPGNGARGFFIAHDRAFWYSLGARHCGWNASPQTLFRSVERLPLLVALNLNFGGQTL